MATIEDLDQKSISEMSVDELLELIRQVRLSRRTPRTTTRKASKAKGAESPSKLSPEQARKLLELLKEE